LRHEAWPFNSALPASQARSGPPIAELRDVRLQYDQGLPVLDGVSLSLYPRSFHVLTGASGAGKSSLLRLLYLAQRPSAGRITLFGEDVARLSRNKLADLRRKIGVVFQDFRLLDHLTTFENIALPLRVQGQKERDYRKDVMELLEWVSIAHRAEAYPPTLSGGEKQRAAIARAVVGKPALLLADEPTGNVDPEMGARLMRLFVELNRHVGTTVVLATHDLPNANALGQPVLHLSQGQLAYMAAPTAPSRSPRAEGAPA
jgi:cell division transport system ATP-binding protein